MLGSAADASCDSIKVRCSHEQSNLDWRSFWDMCMVWTIDDLCGMHDITDMIDLPNWLGSDEMTYELVSNTRSYKVLKSTALFLE